MVSAQKTEKKNIIQFWNQQIVETTPVHTTITASEASDSTGLRVQMWRLAHDTDHGVYRSFDVIRRRRCRSAGGSFLGIAGWGRSVTSHHRTIRKHRKLLYINYALGNMLPGPRAPTAATKAPTVPGDLMTIRFMGGRPF